jgi:hypothetical protein
MRAEVNARVRVTVSSGAPAETLAKAYRVAWPPAWANCAGLRLRLNDRASSSTTVPLTGTGDHGESAGYATAMLNPSGPS